MTRGKAGRPVEAVSVTQTRGDGGWGQGGSRRGGDRCLDS